MKVKELWTMSDYKVMGWHDSRLYGILFPRPFEYSLFFEIDYIFKWVKNDKKPFSFWVSPSTLKFESVSSLSINLDFNNSHPQYISDIKITNERKSPNGQSKRWDVEIELDIKGYIKFSTSGFKQTIKKQPVLQDVQDLDRTVEII